MDGSEPRKTSEDEKDQSNTLKQRRRCCSFSAFYSFYGSRDGVSWAWDGSLWRVLALFPVVVVVERVFPTAAKGWASPVVPASTSAPSGASPTVDSNPPPVDEPGPADCAHRPPLGSSVRCAQGYSAVGYPRATPACRNDSHAHANTASDTSG